MPVPSSDRDANGRFAAGNRGKARGQKNKITREIERLFEGSAEEIAAKAIALAKAGDVTMIKLVIERLAPVRRGRLVNLPDMPRIETIEDVAPALAFLARAVGRGRVTAEEAAAVADVIDRFTKALSTIEYGRRLAELERRQAAGGDRPTFTFELDRPMSPEIAAENARLVDRYAETLKNDGAELEPAGEG